MITRNQGTAKSNKLVSENTSSRYSRASIKPKPKGSLTFLNVYYPKVVESNMQSKQNLINVVALLIPFSHQNLVTLSFANFAPGWTSWLIDAKCLTCNGRMCLNTVLSERTFVLLEKCMLLKMMAYLPDFSFATPTPAKINIYLAYLQRLSEHCRFLAWTRNDCSPRSWWVTFCPSSWPLSQWTGFRHSWLTGKKGVSGKLHDEVKALDA